MAINPEVIKLDACGFYEYYERNPFFKHDKYHPIDREQVEICKKWIKKFLKPTKTIKDDPTSYHYKHMVEEWSGQYISNGAFILAMLELGYNFRKSGPNAVFNAVLAKKERD